MKTYCGHRRDDGTCVVTVSGHGEHGFRALPWRLDLVNHSPDGFEWGYGGSGPSQLALAILADALADDELADRLHQQFKWKFIAGLARDRPWIIKQKDVLAFTARIQEQDA